MNGPRLIDMDSFSFPPQVESLESREMWKGFILTVVEVSAGTCSEPSLLFPPYIPQSSLLSRGRPPAVSQVEPTDAKYVKVTCHYLKAWSFCQHS